MNFFRYFKVKYFTCIPNYSDSRMTAVDGETTQTHRSQFRHWRLHSHGVRCTWLSLRCTCHCHNGTHSENTLHVITYYTNMIVFLYPFNLAFG